MATGLIRDAINDEIARLCARFALERKRRNLTLDEVENGSMVSAATISRLERGEVTPDLRNVIALAMFYHITLTLLPDGDRAAYLSGWEDGYCEAHQAHLLFTQEALGKVVRPWQDN